MTMFPDMKIVLFLFFPCFQRVENLIFWCQYTTTRTVITKKLAKKEMMITSVLDVLLQDHLRAATSSVGEAT